MFLPSLTYHNLYSIVDSRDLTTQFLPTYLRTYRKRTGLTQTEVAYVVGINRSDLWLFETSRREPSLRVLLALQVLYRIPIRKLFMGLFLHCAGTPGADCSSCDGSLLRVGNIRSRDCPSRNWVGFPCASACPRLALYEPKSQTIDTHSRTGSPSAELRIRGI